MAQNPHNDNSRIWECRSWDELVRMASMEQAGDKILLQRNFAVSGTLDTTTPEDVWSAGVNLVLPTTAATASIVSTSTSDASAGVGARSALLNGLDENYDPILEVVTLNGTTPVVTTQSFLRINSMRVISSGTSKHNVGVLTASIGGNVQKYMAATKSIAQCSHFTIPNGYTAFTTGVTLSVFRASGSGTREAEIYQHVYIPSINTDYTTVTYGLTNQGGVFKSSPAAPSQTPQHSTLWFKAVASGANTIVTTSHEIVLIKGDYNLQFTVS